MGSPIWPLCIALAAQGHAAPPERVRTKPNENDSSQTSQVHPKIIRRCRTSDTFSIQKRHEHTSCVECMGAHWYVYTYTYSSSKTCASSRMPRVRLELSAISWLRGWLFRNTSSSHRRHLALENSERVCRSAAGVLEMATWASFNALEMAARASRCRQSGRNVCSGPLQSRRSARSGRSGAAWCCQSGRDCGWRLPSA